LVRQEGVLAWILQRRHKVEAAASELGDDYRENDEANHFEDVFHD
jgi:hypothetical protein